LRKEIDEEEKKDGDELDFEEDAQYPTFEDL